jgi:hypothetical protein
MMYASNPWQIQHLPRRNPQCQGLVERGNRTYEDKRQKFKTTCNLRGEYFNEEDFLASHLYHMNCTVLTMYNVEPFVLLRGRAPATSEDGSALSPEIQEDLRLACALAQVMVAKRLVDRAAPKFAKATEQFTLGDVVLVAATDQQMRKKEARTNQRWGVVARVHAINPASVNFYMLRFITQGHLKHQQPTTISRRWYFGLHLKLAPATYKTTADQADAAASEAAAKKKKGGEGPGDDAISVSSDGEEEGVGEGND